MRALRWVCAVLALLVAVAVCIPAMRGVLIDSYENVIFAFAPSAARAVTYGERHFNARDPGEYDVARAYAFFERAALLDPTYPYLYHELARISFLRGVYPLALAQIDFQLSLHGDSEPNAYYVRGLIEGYMGLYAAAAADYSRYLSFDSADWAAMNDYAWVLLKAGDAAEAQDVATRGLSLFPGNPWLLNTYSIALFETGSTTQAFAIARLAVDASRAVTQAEWLRAYPGNDPGVAAEGVAALQRAAADNMHMIGASLATSTLQ